MEFQRVVERRRMVRSFEDRPVPHEVLERMLSNALRAPSAGFSQGWGFLTLESEDDRARFWDIEWPAGERDGSRRGSMMLAPAVIVPLSHKQAYLDRYAEPDKGWTDRDETRWPVPYWDIDTAFASMLILLSAVDEGLGALFFSLHESREVCDAFGVPAEYSPIGALAIGYGAPDEPSPSLSRGRRGLEQAVHWGRW